MNSLGKVGALFDILITLILADLICGSVFSSAVSDDAFCGKKGTPTQSVGIQAPRRIVSSSFLFFFKKIDCQETKIRLY